ncbi:hypothetical protein [Rubritalea sp.]|uniref:hypothetical protein n=1 Tax=Rubritalea sp. TaxID=2109375 RepID=UPI00324270AC
MRNSIINITLLATNEIEILNFSPRKLLKSKKTSRRDDALVKVLSLSTVRVSKE